MLRSVAQFGMIAAALTLVWCFLSCFGIFKAVSGSMEPLLPTQSYGIYNKLKYGVSTYNAIPFLPFPHPPKYLFRWSHPERGEAVAFSMIERFAFSGITERSIYLKRVIGMPGETVELRSDSTYINNRYLDEPYAVVDGESPTDVPDLFPIHKRHTLQHYGPFVVPKAGLTLDLSEPAALRSWSTVLTEDGAVIDLDKGTIDGSVRTSYTFRHDFYFVLGDNRHNSLDSRWFGPIQENCVVAKLIWP
ncbi:MAG: signal peptidase I [Candidatus Kapabacteria bacterium]|nr:signal peptidase I [Candidatus Kapabacteria bacterium]